MRIPKRPKHAMLRDRIRLLTVSCISLVLSLALFGHAIAEEPSPVAPAANPRGLPSQPALPPPVQVPTGVVAPSANSRSCFFTVGS
jgi:hypothetical protein